MTKAQKTYLFAKAAYETAYSAVNKQLGQEFPEGSIPDDAWWNPETMPLLNRYSERKNELEEATGVNRLRQILRAAETALLNWGQNAIKRRGDLTAPIQELFEVHAVNQADIRRELIDLTLSLSAR